MRLKVLHIINSLTVGGAELLLANSLAKGGIQDHADNFVLYFQGDNPVVLKRIDKNVEVINLAYKGWHTISSLLNRIRSHIKIIKPDIIHTHLNPAGWYTSLVCPKNIPQIHTIHISYSDNTDTGKTQLFFERILLLQKKNANFITLSPLLKDDLLSSVRIKGNVYVLSNFIEDIFFEKTHTLPYDNNLFKLIAIGNMRPQKNYAYLVDIFRHLKGLPVCVDVYGFGDHTFFSQTAEKEGLAVKFMGPASKPNELYQQYNGFIMPSKFEGFGLTAYEAMASGIPVFLSDIPAFKSLINNNALYFSLNNAFDAAQVIKAAVRGKHDLKTMSLNAKVYAEKTVKRQHYIEGLLKIYNNCKIAEKV